MTKSFGNYLRRKRREKNKSQRTLAEEAGINFSYLSKVENDVPGFDSLSEPTLTRIACALEVDPDEMITRAGKIPSDVKQMLVEDFSLIKEIRQTRDRRGAGEDDEHRPPDVGRGRRSLFQRKGPGDDPAGGSE